MRGLLAALLLVLYGFGVGTILHRPLGAPRPLAVAAGFIGAAIAALSALCLASERTLLAFLEAWQAGIGALVGLTGLVLVEAARAEAERRRAADASAEERLSLGAVVASEVRWIRSELERLLRNLADLEREAASGMIGGLSRDRAAALAPAEPLVLTSLLPRLGLLDDGEAVLDLYRHYAEAREQLRRLPFEAGGVSLGELPRVETPAEQVLALADRILEGAGTRATMPRG